MAGINIGTSRRSLHSARELLVVKNLQVVQLKQRQERLCEVRTLVGLAKTCVLCEQRVMSAIAAGEYVVALRLLKTGQAMLGGEEAMRMRALAAARGRMNVCLKKLTESVTEALREVRFRFLFIIHHMTEYSTNILLF